MWGCCACGPVRLDGVSSVAPCAVRRASTGPPSGGVQRSPVDARGTRPAGSSARQAAGSQPPLALTCPRTRFECLEHPLTTVRGVFETCFPAPIETKSLAEMASWSPWGEGNQQYTQGACGELGPGPPTATAVNFHNPYAPGCQRRPPAHGGQTALTAGVAATTRRSPGAGTASPG